jgi:hypothetical protein
MTAELTQALLMKCLEEWRRLPSEFEHMPRSAQADFLNQQGYTSLHDLLAHVAAWWEEAEGIVRDRIAGRERAARTYDFDDFNATALARFKDTSEADLLAWYESERQQMAGLVSSLEGEQLKIRRVGNWLDGVILGHLKEHGLGAPRFLILDMLGREWAGSIEQYNDLTEADRQAYLKKQGFPRFRDIVAHVIAWWEDGMRVIETAADEDPCDVEDVDSFNAAAVDRFGKLEENEVLTAYEKTRRSLLQLVQMAPEEVLSKPNVQAWLRADVIDHYYEHAA